MITTRNVIGPVTADTCLDLPKWNGSYSLMDQSCCWPPRTSGRGPDLPLRVGLGPLARAGASTRPSISRPAGYTSACSNTGEAENGFTFQFPPAVGETAVGCFPRSMSCSINDANVQTCVLTVGDDRLQPCDLQRRCGARDVWGGGCRHQQLSACSAGAHDTDKLKAG
ncbi:hypothetical protein PspLS_11174 [Pyricularia sp. CBS 133598]|nr:hypothetical protein PspLS_11174 [Pyricularia sp. CBS 133598]